MHQPQKETLSTFFSLGVIELIWINVDSDSEKGIASEFLIANMLELLCIFWKGDKSIFSFTVWELSHGTSSLTLQRTVRSWIALHCPDFCKCIGRNRKTRENVSLLLSGVVVTQDADKSELLNAFLPVCITSRICFQKSQALGPVGASGTMQAYPQWSWWKHLNKPDTNKSVGSSGPHPQVLRELADVMARPVSCVFEKSLWGGLEIQWNSMQMPYLASRRRGRTVSLVWISREALEQIILETISKYINDIEMISMDTWTGKLCLINLWLNV